jgi:hypothetical protein
MPSILAQAALTSAPAVFKSKGSSHPHDCAREWAQVVNPLNDGLIPVTRLLLPALASDGGVTVYSSSEFTIRP